MSTSPIVHEDRLILVLDDEANLPDSQLSRSRIVAFEKESGAMAWETARPLHRSGWSTPTIWAHDGGTEVVVLGNGSLRGYDARSGIERWSVSGFSRETIARPIIAAGLLLASASMLGGIADEQPDPEPFWKAVLEFDANGDGKLERGEMTGRFAFPIRPDLPPDHPGYGLPLPRDEAPRKERLDGMFGWIDKDRDGYWTREEFAGALTVGRGMPNLVAVRPGGSGDVTESHVEWALHRGIPEIPSPVFYRDRVYLLQDGGIVSTVDAQSGALVHRTRLGALGHYRASPVVANDHLYAISEEGALSVLKTGNEPALVHQHGLHQRVAATPAIDETTIYIRTATELLAFRSP